MRFFGLSAIVLLAAAVAGCDWIDEVLKDRTAPFVVSAYVRADAPSVIKLELSETVSGVIATDDFAVEVGGSAAVINSAVINASNAGMLDITLSADVAETDSISIDYAPAVGNSLSDNAGNVMLPFADQAVANQLATETFNASNLVTSSYYTVTADLVYEGTHCLIYREQGQSAYLSDTRANELGAEFDANIYDNMVNSFGATSDVDGNSKIVILVLDIIDSYSGSGGYVAGYFDPTDTYAKTTYSASNARDMLYMDCNPGLSDTSTESFRQTMAHELQHLINHNQKVFEQRFTGFDLWINEGMSSAAEKIYAGAQVQWKIDYYNDGGEDIASGANFIKWTGELDSYATVYLFFQWLSIHSSLGDSVYSSIMNRPYTDYRAVEAEVNDSFTGAPVAFSDQLGEWFIANYVNASTGLYGYKGEISTSPQLYTGSSVSLRPGEGVYSAMSSAVTPTGSAPIVFRGVTSGGTVDASGPSYSGNVLISYNGNGVVSGGAVSVSGLPAMILPAMAKSVVPAKPTLPARYPVDVQFDTDGRPVMPKKAAE